MFTYDDHYTIKRMGEGKMSHMVLTSQSEYPKVEFQYGKVQLLEDQENERLVVKFDYEVFDNPERHNTMTKKFKDYIGKILIETLEQELTYATKVEQK